MSARWWTFLVWALVAGSALAWGLKVFVQPPAAPAQALVVPTGPAARGDLTRLLGNDPPPPPVAVAGEVPEPVADARFKLVGVVSPRSPRAAREGLALIAVDGKPPRAYRVGTVVVEPHVLQGVEPRGATLGPRGGAALIALKLQPPAPAATGVLPPLSARGGGPGPGNRSVLQPPLPSLGNASDSDDAEPPPLAEQDNRAPLR
jgi:general secretion pathway protein C